MKKENIDLILASSSKNRELILKKVINSFEIFNPNVNEEVIYNEDPKSVTRRLSYQKAMQARSKFENKAILAADTVVHSRRMILDKTLDKEKAKRNLKNLSGRRHRVYTGVTFITDNNKCVQYVCKSTVKFKVLENYEIERYLCSNEWKNSAGSYSIQGYAESFVEMILGSHSNIVGLPMHIIYKILKNNRLL